ncbi:MAG TPA: hydrogenase maturation nickel metallochaperone HypA [Tepidisphaeraceae bacterium]|jgi:hydrogenase nickel incorporation protein HypA/HybF|nr:hydrogenase maturation nickel metallochaperone HypA [Tepidisphaeraceae bacterium]
MHELSVAQELVELVELQLADSGPIKVNSVLLRIGPLSGVVPQAMRFAYDAATAGTRLAGSSLQIEEVAPVIFCQPCNQERALPSIQRMRCPVCDAPAADVVRGRELEVVSVEVIDDDR